MSCRLGLDVEIGYAQAQYQFDHVFPEEASQEEARACVLCRCGPTRLVQLPGHK